MEDIHNFFNFNMDQQQENKTTKNSSLGAWTSEHPLQVQCVDIIDLTLKTTWSHMTQCIVVIEAE